MSIRILNEETILKIAAGEVIENPASVVKELVENSIDAKATQITVEIKNGGKTHIRVTDDGEGIQSDDIELAFTRHATSKVTNYEDLFRIASMGFRGEALPSIRAVSRVTVLTRRADEEAGSYVKYHDPDPPICQTVAHNKGTTVLVEDLFGRLPVRAGFMKSALAEANRITDLMYRFAVANPLIAFKYIKDDKVLIRTGGSSAENAIIELFGPEISEQLISVRLTTDHLTISGWIGKPSLFRGNRSMQYLFANQRIIQDTNFVQIVESEYTSKIPHGRYPVFFLWLTASPDLIDVNIHPSKQKVQWLKGNLFEPLRDEIRKLFLQSDERNLLKEKEETKKPERVNLYTMEEYLSKKERESKIQERISEPLTKYQKTKSLSTPVIGIKTPKEVPTQIPLKMPQSVEKKSANDWLFSLRFIGIMAKTYFLFEDAARMEMVLIDQHAAHERILYESLMQKQEGKEILTQMLLVPQTLRVKPQEEELLENNLSLLENLGFIAESMGQGLFAIRGIPHQFGDMQQPQNLFYSLLDTLHKDITLPKQDLRDRLIKRACTEAVKAGDHMQEMSVNELISALSKTQHPHTCPHGRPTYVRIPLKSMHKWFQRIPS